MKIIRNNNAENIVINNEQKFRLDLGWQENLVDFENEVLESIINPALNYETVRYIHTEYNGLAGPQTDIWFSFFFISGSTYVQDYSAPSTDITHRENELMLKQATESFFRLEFFKTPSILDANKNVIGFEKPTRQNRKLVFAKNLSLPLGEKYLYKDSISQFYIHVPVFQGSNYRNKENMYLFWFDDEKVIDDTDFFGNGTGNTFFMSAKFMNAKTAEIQDFTNSGFTTGHTVNDTNDMYYQVDFNHISRTYCVFPYTGGSVTFHTGCTLSERVGWNTGTTFNPIKFYERGGANVILATPTPLPTATPTPTPAYGATPTPTPALTATPTPTPEPTLSVPLYYYLMESCVDGLQYYSIGYTTIDADVNSYVYESNGTHYRIVEVLFNTINPDTTFNNKTIFLSPATSCPIFPTATPTPTPDTTATPTPTPNPTLTPTPTATVPAGVTLTPTPTPTVTPAPTATPTPTPLPYTVTGSSNAGYSNNGYATGTLTIDTGHSVKVTLNVFGGTTPGGSNTGVVMGDISLSATANAFTVNSTQNITLTSGVYNFTITSSFDNGKYAYINFETV